MLILMLILMLIHSHLGLFDVLQAFLSEFIVEMSFSLCKMRKMERDEKDGER